MDDRLKSSTERKRETLIGILVVFSNIGSVGGDQDTARILRGIVTSVSVVWRRWQCYCRKIFPAPWDSWRRGSSNQHEDAVCGDIGDVMKEEASSACDSRCMVPEISAVSLRCLCGVSVVSLLSLWYLCGICCVSSISVFLVVVADAVRVGEFAATCDREGRIATVLMLARFCRR